MKTNNFSRPLILLVIILHFSATAPAQPSFTSASGITQVTIPGDSWRLIAATLNGELVHESTATINSDWTDFGSPPRQTITVSGADWEYDQWTTPDAHLAYISDASGNEEAFLIRRRSNPRQHGAYCGAQRAGHAGRICQCSSVAIHPMRWSFNSRTLRESGGAVHVLLPGRRTVRV